MSQTQANNPLHGIKLEKIVTQLVDHYGWSSLGKKIKINCFISDPSIKSSLKFLRRTQWARDKVEDLYLDTFYPDAKKPIRANNADSARKTANKSGGKKTDKSAKANANPWQAWEK